MGRNGSYPESVQPGIPRLGRQPKGWGLVTLGDVLRVISRPAKLVNNQKYHLITARRSRGGIVLRGIKSGQEIRTKTQFYVKTGDFLISRRQIVHGGCGLVPPELDSAVVSNEYLVLHTKAGLRQDYLRWLSHSIYFQQTCFHASIGVHVEKMVFNPERWFRFQVYLPLEKEQEKISSVLFAWDRALSQLSELIEAKRKLKKGLIQKLLSGKWRLPGFSGRWRRMEFVQIAAPSKKRHDSKKEVENLPCIELENISQGDGRLLDTTDSKRQSLKTAFEKGDVLFGKLRPNLRKYHLCSFRGVCSTEIWALKPDYAVCTSAYLYWIVQTARFIEAACVTSGSKMPRADWGWVSEQPFSLPPIAEQNKIAAVLDAVDSELAALCSLKNYFGKQKHGLMKKLLTGQARMGV